MASSPKLLVIGLDGATFDVLGPLAKLGHLPNLSALMDQGCWGRLASTIPPFTATAWSSFITGHNPGKHGILSFRKRDRFNYDVQGSGFVDARCFGATLWEILGAAGKRVGVVNVPLTYPARPVNGYMVTGMLTPPDALQFTYPTGFAKRLGTDYIIDVDFIRDEETFRLSGFPPKVNMLAQIRHMAQVRAETCARLLQEEPWDFFMVVFTSTDRIMHFFWDDLSVLTSRSQAPNSLQQDLLAFFHELDDSIGRLVRLAGPSTTTLIISDHGFGPAPTRRLYLNVWLEKLGLLKRREAQGFFDLEYWRVRVGRNKRLKAALRRLLPQSAQDTLSIKAATISDDIIAWHKTQAYFVPIYFHVCGVEINLQELHREGIVEPGEYKALRERIIRDAAQLTDLDGTPIVEIAARREELFDGPQVEQFPDVILVLDPDYVGAPSLAGSSLVEAHSHPMRPGEHRQDGILVACGPFVESQGELPGLNLLDVPPTILYAMELPIPTSFDGRVLKEIFTAGHLANHPVTFSDDLPLNTPWSSTQKAYSSADEIAIEERLRGLGYLD